MPIKDYSEKEIREKIINKAKPEIKKGRSKHSKGYIWIEGKLVGKVKIPNAHQKIMKKSRSQFIATALRLSPDEFNSLVDCSLTGPNYYSLLKERT